MTDAAVITSEASVDATDAGVITTRRVGRRGRCRGKRLAPRGVVRALSENHRTAEGA